MKLTVIRGYSELLLPIPVASEELEALFRTVDREAIVARAAWAHHDGAGPYHSFLYDVPGDADRRVDLFLEYLEDSASHGAHPFVVLPFDSILGGGAIEDTRVQHLIARCEARFGAAAVRHRWLSLSSRTAEVLRGLAAHVGASAAPSGPPVDDVDVERLSGRGAAFQAMSLNYNHAILALGERLVARSSVWRWDRGHVAALARALAADGMRLDVDLSLAPILEQLGRGGELFTLLTQPAPRLAAAAAASAPKLMIEVPRPPDVGVERGFLDLSSIGSFRIGKELELGGFASYEPEVVAALCAYIETRERPVRFLDVGANVGVFSLLVAALFGRRTEIVAFEPLLGPARFLREAVVRNGLAIDVRELAASNRDGTAPLHVSLRNDTSSSLNPGFRDHEQSIPVAIRRLDGLCDGAGERDHVLKIDTASTEPDVLDGAEALIARARPAVICEVLAGRSEDRLTAFFARHDYRAYHLCDRPTLEPADAIAGDPSGAFRNWLFLPSAPDARFSERLVAWQAALRRDPGAASG